MRAFAYHRAVAPMMWVLVAIASAELIVVHLLLALWKPWLAAVVSLVTAASVAWLVAVIASMRRLPVLVEEARLVMRVGTLKRIDVPLEAIAGLREHWDAAALKDRAVLNLALIAYPNVVIDLSTPLQRGRRAITAVAHRLDDPAAFTAALRELGRAA